MGRAGGGVTGFSARAAAPLDRPVYRCNLAPAMTAAPVSITNAESLGKKK
jgi:hypothetical protein